MKPTPGIVAIIDLLGYQNFVDNNNASDAVTILQDVFSNLKEAVISDYTATWTKATQPDILRFEHLVIQTFSDTIVIHIPFEEKKQKQPLTWLAILQTVRILQRRLFERGFPSRGAIDCGEYFFDNNFLVGKPFMDAYRLGQQLELAGTALTDAAEKRFKRDMGLIWEKFVGGIHYLAPFKNRVQKNCFLLSILRGNEIDTGLESNLEHFVYASFWKHGKDVPHEVDEKVFQTVKFLRFWLCKRGKVGQAASASP